MNPTLAKVVELLQLEQLEDNLFRGGSPREERLDVLTRRMQEHDVQLEDYDWFLDLRRYGTVPHAGFGLSFERLLNYITGRLLNYITGMSNIRDVIPYPRTPGNAPF